MEAENDTKPDGLRGKPAGRDLTLLGRGLYEITSAEEGQAMDVHGQPTSGGGSVDQWDYPGGANQQFLSAIVCNF